MHLPVQRQARFFQGRVVRITDRDHEDHGLAGRDAQGPPDRMFAEALHRARDQPGTSAASMNTIADRHTCFASQKPLW